MRNLTSGAYENVALNNYKHMAPPELNQTKKDSDSLNHGEHGGSGENQAHQSPRDPRDPRDPRG